MLYGSNNKKHDHSLGRYEVRNKHMLRVKLRFLRYEDQRSGHGLKHYENGRCSIKLVEEFNLHSPSLPSVKLTPGEAKLSVSINRGSLVVCGAEDTQPCFNVTLYILPQINFLVVDTNIDFTNMSVTTTANPVSATVLQALTDYDLHHSGAPETPGTPSPPNQQSTVHAETPENWDREHRRVPPYRPIDRSLLGPERPDGVNGIERTFIYLMLNGVGVVAV